jgi:hypothetical protein
MFEMFARRTLPKPQEISDFEFTTVNPGVSGRCHWVSIQQQQKPLAPSRVKVGADRAANRVVATSENVALLSLDLAHLDVSKAVELEIDGDKLSIAAGSAAAHLRRSADHWILAGAPEPQEKSIVRSGPFKEAFHNRMIFVAGRQGTPEENEWALRKARFDAEQFWVRGNGSVDVVFDRDFNPNEDADRSVILYGNADTNSAWQPLLGSSPMQIKRGEAKIGETQCKGSETGAIFVRPRPGSAKACVAAVSGTGIVGMSLTDRLSYFTSGVAYPDYCLFKISDGKANDGVAGVDVFCAGFFGNDWSVKTGESFGLAK